MSEPEKTAAVLPDWVMLDRSGRNIYYGHDDDDDDDPAAIDDEALKNKYDETTAVSVVTSSGRSGYFSFTLAVPPRISYLELHWPRRPTKSSEYPYPSVLAADENLVLLRIAIPSMRYHVPQDLFVYTAAGPSPTLLRLPLHTVPAPKHEDFRKFFASKSDIGILRLAGDQGHYVVADLLLVSDGDKKNKVAQLCVFSSASKTRNRWRVFTEPALPPSDGGGRFPVWWLTSTVLPFDGRFLCWVDYYVGLLLSDFSETNAPALRFMPFPGERYTDEMLRSTQSRCCPDRYWSVSVSQGKMRFVHIDNDFHQRNRVDVDDTDDDTDDDDDEGVPKSAPKITIWTLNVAEFKWEEHREMDLEKLWAHPGYQDQGIPPRRLPEFPVIAVDDPDIVWCVLRKKEFRGKAWMAEVDMKRAELRSCTPYVDGHYRGQNMKLKNGFANTPPLPTVFSKYLAGIVVGDSDEFTTRSSKKVKLSM